MKKWRLMFGLVVITALLSSCGFEIFNSEGIVFGIEPGNLGYSVSSSGEITVSTRELVLHTKSGAMGATIEGFRVYWFDENGDPLDLDNNISFSEGSLGIYVPAGLRCDDTDAEVGCTVNSPGVEFVRGPTIRERTVNLLPSGVVLAHINAGYPVGWYGEVELYGFNDVGAGFVSKRLRVTINPPS